MAPPRGAVYRPPPLEMNTSSTAMRRFALGLLPAAILLSGCAADEPPPPCPPVQAPASLDRFTWFEGGGRDLTQVLYSGRIDGVDMACEYDEEGVDLDLRELGRAQCRERVCQSVEN